LVIVEGEGNDYGSGKPFIAKCHMFKWDMVSHLSFPSYQDTTSASSALVKGVLEDFVYNKGINQKASVVLSNSELLYTSNGTLSMLDHQPHCGLCMANYTA
jgi:hypothetical protein